MTCPACEKPATRLVQGGVCQKCRDQFTHDHDPKLEKRRDGTSRPDYDSTPLGEQSEHVIPTEFDWNELLGRFGEHEHSETHDRAREIAAKVLLEFVRWVVEPRIPVMNRRCTSSVGARLLGAAYVINPAFFDKVPLCPAAIARRMGFSMAQIGRLNLEGKLDETIRSATDDQRYASCGSSLRNIAKFFGCTAGLISPHSAEFSRVFGITNGGQCHDWRAMRAREGGNDGET